MRVNFETKIAAGSLVAVAILVAVGALSVARVRDAAATSRMVAETYEVLTETQAILAAMTDAEAGMRGYLLTGAPVYLQRQTQDFERTDQALQTLALLMRDQPERQQRLAALRAKTEEERAFLQEITQLRERVGAVAALTTFGTGRGQEIMEEARRIAEDLEQRERELLATRQREAEESATRSERVVVLATVVDAALLGLAVFMVRREMRKRHGLEEALRAEAERLSSVVRMQGEIASHQSDLHEVLEMVTQQTLQLTGATGASVDLVEGDRLVERAGTRVAGAALAQLTAECIERQEAIVCDDLGAGDYRSAILVPLRTDARVVGVLKVLSEKPQGFTRADAQALELIAGFIATAMQNASATEARQQLIEQLTALNEELEAFSYSVSHDLRAPLRHIDGFVGLLQLHAGEAIDAKGRHYMDVIAQSARQMGVLIDELLAFARTARAEVQRVEVNMEALVQSVVERLAPDLEERQVDWKIGALPPVQADAAMMRQVLTNLLSNAVKYTRTRSPAVIEIGAETKGGEILFHVRDNGVGFDSQYASKLFGVFQRLHRHDEFEGTGIGLANVRRIVQKHGGRTWAEGTPDAGATFWFSIPAAAAA